VPKLRGFKNAFKVEYQVVNVGRIAEYAAAGRFGVEVDGQPAPKAKKGAASAPVSVNPAALAAAGLIGTERKPVKILGQGEIDKPLFVAAEAFTASARTKIEAAGGFVQLLAADGQPVAEAKAEPATAPKGKRRAAAQAAKEAAKPETEAAAEASEAREAAEPAAEASEAAEGGCRGQEPPSRPPGPKPRLRPNLSPGQRSRRRRASAAAEPVPGASAAAQARRDAAAGQAASRRRKASEA
jgi:ribosomal protein L15